MYRSSHEYEHYFITLIFSEIPTTSSLPHPPAQGSNLKRSCVHNCSSSMDGHGSLYVCTLLCHFILPYVHTQKKEQHANGS